MEKEDDGKKEEPTGTILDKIPEKDLQEIAVQLKESYGDEYEQIPEKVLDKLIVDTYNLKLGSKALSRKQQDNAKE